MAGIKDYVSKDGKLTYKITVSLGYDHGKKIQKTTTFKPTSQAPTKARKEAEAFAVEFEKAVKNNTACLEAEKMTFKDLVKEWDEIFLHRKIQIGKLSEHCREDYIKLLNNHVIPNIGSKKLSNISPRDIDKIINKLLDEKKSNATIKKIFVVTNNIFTYARRKKILLENPCEDCDPIPEVKRKKEHSIFSEDQLNRFVFEALSKEYDTTISKHTRKYSAYNGTHEKFTVHEFTEKRSIPLQFRTFFTLAAFSGARRGELLALDWCDIDFNENTIDIHKSVSKTDDGQFIKGPKTEAGNRTIPLPEVCFDLLKDWKKEQTEICMKLGSAWEGFRGRDYDKNPVFIQVDSGKRMYIDSPSQKFRKILKDYNETVPEDKKLPMIRLHDLRHTYISHLLSNGMDPEELKKVSGHSKASIPLDIYGHALEKNKGKAASIMESIIAKAQ